MSPRTPGLPAWLARAIGRPRGRGRGPRVRLAAPGAEPRILAPDDPVAKPLIAAAEAVLSAAHRASRR